MFMTSSRSIRTLFLHPLSFECTLKLEVKYLNQFSINFHIEIVYDTNKVLNHVLDQLVLNSLYNC